MTDFRKDNRGAALVWVLLTLTLAGILSTGLMMLIVNRARTQSVDVDKTKEYYVADGVAELVKQGASTDTIEAFADAPVRNDPPEANEVAIVLPDDNTIIYYGPHYVTQITWTGESYTVTQTPRTLLQGGDGE